MYDKPKRLQHFTTTTLYSGWEWALPINSRNLLMRLLFLAILLWSPPEVQWITLPVDPHDRRCGVCSCSFFIF